MAVFGEKGDGGSTAAIEAAFDIRREIGLMNEHLRSLGLPAVGPFDHFATRPNTC